MLLCRRVSGVIASSEAGDWRRVVDGTVQTGRDGKGLGAGAGAARREEGI